MRKRELAAETATTAPHSWTRGFRGLARTSRSSWCTPPAEARTEAKQHWDPDNVFRLNQNISPHPG
ncbi:BBE domain-containing protein [Streptomyces sp. NPDC002092]